MVDGLRLHPCLMAGQATIEPGPRPPTLPRQSSLTSCQCGNGPLPDLALGAASSDPDRPAPPLRLHWAGAEAPTLGRFP